MARASIDLEASSSQYLSAVDSASLSVTGNFTIECWVYLESQPSAASYCIASKYSGSGDQRSYLVGYQDNAGTKRFYVNTSSTGNSASSGTLNHTLSLATWTHIAFVYTAASSAIEIFVNGASVGTISGLTSSIFNGTAQFFVGRDDSTSYFDGLIDELRLWSVARSGADILANMKLDIASATNLNASYSFDNVLTDGSGNANTLTNNGSAVFSTNPHPFDLDVGVSTLTISAPTVSILTNPTGTLSPATLTLSSPLVTTVAKVNPWVNTTKAAEAEWSNTVKP